ncbi:MAG: DUF6115 domain-containing protein [Muribaculaceae bacterium]|nr:DUF6115 domain-containing protein [Muribaculaceae bacterium]
MTALEVILILVGVAFILVSFFVEEKLSRKDIDRIASLSEEELKIIVERQLRNAADQVEDSIAETIAETSELTKRAMEKETNEKIMAINEYSDTVIESMNKTHSEILFLYNMLNDKHVELTTLAEQLQDFSRQMRSTEHQMLDNMAEAAKELEQTVQKAPALAVEDLGVPEPVDFDEPHVEPVITEAQERANHNSRILALHKEGIADVEIARQLGLGLGEVRLVIGLYRGSGR